MNTYSSELLLDVNNIVVTFEGADKPAIQDVSFQLHRDEVLGIVGETGAGKSVLARSLLNLLPEGGQVKGGDIQFPKLAEFYEHTVMYQEGMLGIKLSSFSAM